MATHPKYAAWRPEDLALVIPSVFWKCLLRVSSRPYEKPQRKKRMVTRQMGSSDSRSVSSAALVRFLSEVRRDRSLQNGLDNILGLAVVRPT